MEKYLLELFLICTLFWRSYVSKDWPQKTCFMAWAVIARFKIITFFHTQIQLKIDFDKILIK